MDGRLGVIGVGYREEASEKLKGEVGLMIVDIGLVLTACSSERLPSPKN